MKQTPQTDTIFALSTPLGVGGVSVFRISGPGARTCLATIAGLTDPKPRKAYYRPFKNPDEEEIIDQGLALFFPAPASFTGEDCAEFQTHGGHAVQRAMYAAFSRMGGLRLAEPGEFTRRAFENGKMDLTESEAVADLIHAQTELQRRQALSQISGSLSKLYIGWHDKLKELLAYIEAEIDFPDEDLPEKVLERCSVEAQKLEEEIHAHLDDNRRGERLRDGLRVAIIGAPNAGKSSLINALARRDVAIVSETPGTTRDIIEVYLDLAGYPLILSDTAGLRPEHLLEGAHGEIEGEGIRRARQSAEEADIRILVFDATLSAPDESTLELLSAHSLVALNKTDCLDGRPMSFVAKDQLAVSAKARTGLQELLQALENKAAEVIGTADMPSLSRARHREALEDCLESLKRAQGADMPELVAEDVRLAMRALGRITGKVDVEDLLDVIFRDFCIGK